MDTRSLHALELPKVLEYLAGFAVSESGRQACLALRPFEDIAATERQAAYFEQGRLWVLRSRMQVTPFVPLDDFLHWVERPASILDLEGLWELRRMLSQVHLLSDSILSLEQENLWPLWVERCRELPLPRQSISGLQRCISDDGRLRDEASPELSLVRGELRRLHRQCIHKVKDYAAEYNILHYLQDAFMTLSSDRYVLPLKANFKGKLQGVIHDYSQTGETCYFEPMFLVEMNNRLQELKREEREEERKIFLYLSDLVRGELPGVRAAYDFLVALDVLQAKTALGDCYDGRIVPFDADRGARLREARHPLLLLAERAAAGPRHTHEQENAFRDEHQITNFASRAKKAGFFAKGADSYDPRPERKGPIDAAFGQKAYLAKVVSSTLELLPEQQALIISGGNAGGKTVSLKSLGLITLMALCALPVPVESGSFLPPWRRIHAFIGDEQSLDDHVSTFTAQITHLARIWPDLDRDSLVLLDEFGAGTDPSQGAALAQAVVDAIMDKGAYVAAATHFPALKAYALSTAGVRAASVLFDPNSRKPLFRLVYDQVGASQALDVAREHGLPEDILARASQYLLISGEDTSALVERLNALAVERERELADLAGEKRAFEDKKAKLTERFAKEREQLFASVRADARQIMNEWKTSRMTHKQALKELSRVRGELAALLPEQAGQADGQGTRDEPRSQLNLADLALRGRVRHIPWKRVGTILEIDSRKNRVRLDLDGVSLWADAADLAHIQNDGALHQASGGGRGVLVAKGGAAAKAVGAAENCSVRLDLRGLRADVAVNTLEKFLDSALLDGWSEVEVIHGRGTGALRRELHTFLQRFPVVKSFRLAPEDRGGDGMTMVELR